MRCPEIYRTLSVAVSAASACPRLFMTFSRLLCKTTNRGITLYHHARDGHSSSLPPAATSWDKTGACTSCPRLQGAGIYHHRRPEPRISVLLYLHEPTFCCSQCLRGCSILSRARRSCRAVAATDRAVWTPSVCTAPCPYRSQPNSRGRRGLVDVSS